MYSSAEVITVLLQRGDGFLKIFFFDEDVVGVVGGYGEDADLMLGEDRRDLGEDPDQRKVQYADDAKGAPSVLAVEGGSRGGGGFADEGQLFVGLADEKEVVG